MDKLKIDGYGCGNTASDVDDCSYGDGNEFGNGDGDGEGGGYRYETPLTPRTNGGGLGGSPNGDGIGYGSSAPSDR